MVNRLRKPLPKATDPGRPLPEMIANFQSLEWVSVKDIARITGRHTVTIYRLIKKAFDEGSLTEKKRVGKGFEYLRSEVVDVIKKEFGEG